MTNTYISLLASLENLVLYSISKQYPLVDNFLNSHHLFACKIARPVQNSPFHMLATYLHLKLSSKQ